MFFQCPLWKQNHGTPKKFIWRTVFLTVTVSIWWPLICWTKHYILVSVPSHSLMETSEKLNPKRQFNEMEKISLVQLTLMGVIYLKTQHFEVVSKPFCPLCHKCMLPGYSVLKSWCGLCPLWSSLFWFNNSWEGEWHSVRFVHLCPKHLQEGQCWNTMSPTQRWCAEDQNTAGAIPLVFTQKIICKSLDCIF